MQLYRFIIRHEHIIEDLALAAQHAEILKNDKDFKGEVRRKEKPAFADHQRDGEVWIAHGTPKELKSYTDYEKA